MSLQVWLPLNKKIVNAGLGNVNVINNGVTISDNGILGKCGSFTTSQYIELTSVPFSKLNNCSVSFWIKLDASENEWLLVSGQNEQCYILAWRSETFKDGNFYHGSSASVSKIYVDGVESNKPIKDGNWHHYCAVGTNLSTWTKFYLNNYIATPSYNFTGLLNDFRIYDYALSAADVLRIYQNRNIYEIPIVPGSPTPDLPLWVKILHHNVPSSNLFTTANAKKNTTENLYSRLGIYFNSTIFKNPYGKYEFLAKEKLESGSTEKSYQWRQTSSPTASTIAGFESIKNTNNSERLIGLKSTNSYATFHNGSSWWCACGSYTAFQGGIPGFGNVVKSGYLDLYAKARIGHLPKSYENEYEELEYIEGTGTQWIDTEYLVNSSNISKLKYKLDGIATNTAIGNKWWANGIGGGNGITFYVGIGNGKDSPLPFTYGRGVSDAVTSVNGSLGVRYKWELDMEKKTYKVWSNDGDLLVSTTFTRQTPTEQKTLPLFRWRRYNDQGGYIFGMKIYHMQLFDDSILVRDMVPSKRKSDNVIGMYDLVSKNFFTNQGTGVFDAGPSVISLPKEYEKLEYIKSTGTQWINTQFVPGAGTKLKIKFKQESAQTNSTYYPISCVRANDNKLLLECFIRQTNLYALSVAGNEFTGNYDPVTSMLDIELSLTKVVINGNVVRTGSTVSVTNSRPLFLLAYNKDGNPDTTRYMSCNLYEAKIYETENGLDLLKMNLVPSKRKSDNVIGMYDIVSGQFFTNSGTGSFTGA